MFIVVNAAKYRDQTYHSLVCSEQLFLKQVALLEKLDHNFTRVLQQAIFHGRSLGLTAQIERNGIPLNLTLYNDLDKYYDEVRELFSKL